MCGVIPSCCPNPKPLPHPPPASSLQMRQLCAAVAPHLPEFVLGEVLLELLHVDLQAGERFL